MAASAAATRTLSIVLGLAAVGLAVAITWQGMSRWRPPKIESDAGADAGAGYTFDLDASLAPITFDLDAGDLAPRAPRDGGPGFTMPDGHPPPPLPENAPAAVRFGVVLVSYAGAEDAPHGARSKKDALELAEKLAAQAKTDFHAAVRRGDDGSLDDVGSMRRGFVEPAPEYVLFTLPVGGVSDPIDTPRGFWIVKRIE
ncbi:MAG TPA: peptidylprolyl isomerase [Polyangiaceae bacterium]